MVVKRAVRRPVPLVGEEVWIMVVVLRVGSIMTVRGVMHMERVVLRRLTAERRQGLVRHLLDIYLHNISNDTQSIV